MASRLAMKKSVTVYEKTNTLKLTRIAISLLIMAYLGFLIIQQLEKRAENLASQEQEEKAYDLDWLP